MIWTLGFDRRAVTREILAAISKAPIGWMVEICEAIRTTPQNRRFQAMLGDIAKQCLIRGGKKNKEEWKCIFMRAAGKEMQVLPELYGDGFFGAGYRSSKLKVSEMSDLMMYIQAYGDEQGVAWSDPSQRQDDGR